VNVIIYRFLMALFLCLCSLNSGALESLGRSRATAHADLLTRLAEVQLDPKLMASLIKAGAKVSSVCANCHGVGGSSSNPDIPNLAGQNTLFLIEQNRQYADGKRDDEFMGRLMRFMTTDEKIGLALFFTEQKVAPQPVLNPALATKGKQPFSKNCASCHHDDGMGEKSVARLAGQQSEYLKEVIMHYREGTDVLLDRNCSAAIKRLTEPEIDAVVAYVRSLK
jgi:cytochrome c553